ncbi:MAG: hypothetical protein HQM10_12195 [Candidatus Riflebacteria bacterium]|nr:hypothetical protein [Candidatus Riflebacteria bacterium]
MKKRYIKRLLSWLVIIFTISISLTGCNLFEPVDNVIQELTLEERVAQGKIAMERGEYLKADDIFVRVLAEDPYQLDAIRGHGQAIAGVGGFNMFYCLNVLQNGTGPYDNSIVLFELNALKTQILQLEKSMQWLSKDVFPTPADRITRAFVRLSCIVRSVLEKYDTNHNKKLDSYDEINFSTNANASPDWSEFRRQCLYGPASSGVTLEECFTDLFYGLEGRGASWTFITPISKRNITGVFTEINRSTLTAVSDLAQKLKTADAYYGTDLQKFAAVIRELDGAE